MSCTGKGGRALSPDLPVAGLTSTKGISRVSFGHHVPSFTPTLPNRPVRLPLTIESGISRTHRLIPAIGHGKVDRSDAPGRRGHGRSGIAACPAVKLRHPNT